MTDFKLWGIPVHESALIPPGTILVYSHQLKHPTKGHTMPPETIQDDEREDGEGREALNGSRERAEAKIVSDKLLAQLDAFFEEFKNDGIDRICLQPRRHIESGGHGIRSSHTRRESITVFFDDSSNDSNDTVKNVTLTGGPAEVELHQYPNIQEAAIFYERLIRVIPEGAKS